MCVAIIQGATLKQRLGMQKFGSFIAGLFTAKKPNKRGSGMSGNPADIHCIASHCTTLHCIILHCIASHHIASHQIALHCMASHHIAGHHLIACMCMWSVLHCSSALHYIDTTERLAKGPNTFICILILQIACRSNTAQSVTCTGSFSGS